MSSIEAGNSHGSKNGSTTDDVHRQTGQTRGSARGRDSHRHGIPGSRGRDRSRSISDESRNRDRALAALDNLQSNKAMMKNEIERMDPDRLRSLCLKMAQRHPSLMFDVLKPADRQLGGYHPPPGTALPDWCTCTKCRQMPTTRERVCCGKQMCISTTPNFKVLVLDEGVLAIARMYRRDILVFGDDSDVRKANRHQANRQFILWQHGMLGDGDKHVVPSCCEWAIRDKFPDPFGQYPQFMASRLS